MDNGNGTGKINVFVVDQHPLILMSLQTLLDSQGDMKVCGKSNDTREALQVLAGAHADIVITGLSFNNGPGGLEFLKDVRIHFPKLRTLVLSSHTERSYAERAMKAGAQGYVSKTESPEEILLAVRTVYNDGVHLSKNILSIVVRQFASGVLSEGSSPVQHLADRELEVFQLLGQGRETRQIAESLNVSMKTVQAFCARIKSKLKLASATELLREAVRWHESQQPK